MGGGARTALGVLTKRRLATLGRDLGIELPPAATKDEQLARLEAGDIALERLLPRLTRDELRTACRARDLDPRGRRAASSWRASSAPAPPPSSIPPPTPATAASPTPRACRTPATSPPSAAASTYQLKDPSVTDPEIEHFRSLHLDLDRAVLTAYGWTDILATPGLSPFTTPQTPNRPNPLPILRRRNPRPPLRPECRACRGGPALALKP
jgi:hypothetical protein